MFKRLPIAPRPSELLARAFRRASKAAGAVRARGRSIELAKRREEQRVKAASQIVRKGLSKLIDGTPSLSNLPPFYRELADALVGIDRMKKTLGAIDGTVGIIDKLEREHLRRLRAARSPAEATAVRKQAYGRISSVVERAGGHLTFLREAAIKLANLPSVYVDVPTIVIAGYPNVGKTALLRQLTGSEPEIAPYPFTTKGLQLGYFEHARRLYQVIDTPGLLDRPLERRNPIERQAIAALQNLADVVVFLLDPSETCGYDMKSQLHLLEDIQKTFAGVQILPLMNKADLLDEDQTRRAREACRRAIFISSLTGMGIQDLLREMLKALSSSEP
ncbi:MAG: 50S ribosome-binding GTPase [Candidatus Hodarchaeaceae archaeon]|nr:50S ribosome-binding GTPase [Candidatus Hodarchaeaceae archaeon]